MIKTVIFDLDGTLIDTEKYYREFWPKAFAHFGIHMTDEEALSMRSLGTPYSREHIHKLYGEHVDVEAVRAKEENSWKPTWMKWAWRKRRAQWKSWISLETTASVQPLQPQQTRYVRKSIYQN